MTWVVLGLALAAPSWAASQPTTDAGLEAPAGSEGAEIAEVAAPRSEATSADAPAALDLAAEPAPFALLPASICRVVAPPAPPQPTAGPTLAYDLLDCGPADADNASLVAVHAVWSAAVVHPEGACGDVPLAPTAPEGRDEESTPPVPPGPCLLPARVYSIGEEPNAMPPTRVTVCTFVLREATARDASGDTWGHGDASCEQVDATGDSGLWSDGGHASDEEGPASPA